MLVIAGFAAYAATSNTTSLKKSQAQKTKTVKMVHDGDAVEATAATPAPATTASGSGGAATLDQAAKPATANGLAAPANDECGGAITVPDGPYPVLSAVTNVEEATPQGIDSGETPSCAQIDYTVWYKFTPSVTTLYTISTCAVAGATGSTVYDTIVGVLESTAGSCPAATEVGCNDVPDTPGCSVADNSSPGGYFDQGTMSAVLNAGTTYLIVAGHWSGDAGGVQPGFDDIRLRIDRSNAPVNDTCAGVLPLTLNRVTVGTTAAAADDYQSPATAACFAGVGQTPSASPGRDVVYSFTAPAAGSYSVRWVSDAPSPALRGQDPTLYASSSCPASGAVSCLLGGNRQTAATGQNKAEEIYCLPMTSGQTIYVYFDDAAAGNGGGPFDLEVTECRKEVEPNDSVATATPYSACFMEGTVSPGGAAGDIDFFDLGNIAAGAHVFASLDSPQTPGTGDFAMRLTSSTDTLQFDDNDGASVIASNSPVIAGTPAPGGNVYVRLNHNAAAGGEPYHLYARVETGAAQVEVEPNNPAPNSLNYFLANPITNGGYVRGVASADTDLDCFRFVAYEGDDLVFFGGGNPNRAAGLNTDVWPLIFDLAGSGYNLQAFGGQVLRNTLTASPGTLTGTTPSITSEFWAHRAKYTGAQLVCFTPLQPVCPGTPPNCTGIYPLPWAGSVSRNCGPLPIPANMNTDLVVTKTAPTDPVPTSAIFDYTVSIQNPSATDIATDVRISDNLPDNLTLVGVFVDDDFGGNNVDCDQLDEDLISCINYSIAPGATTTFTIRVQVNECVGPLTLSNTASVTTTANDPDLANNTSTAVITTVDGPCSDNNPCTDDACSGGVCVGTPDDTNACDDNNPCTDDFCNVGTCQATPNSAPCNDNLFCTVGDACVGGSCTGAPNPCNDSDPCTIDQCDENSGCFSSFSEGEICDDGDPCTAVDICLATDPNTGDPAEGCYGFEPTTCDDGLNCTTDTCDGAGGCIFTPVDCEDGNPCTDNSCDETAGCVSSNNSNPCDDGNPCTTGDACGGGSCQPGGPTNCDDGDACTADSCGAGGCVHTPITCDDGDACTTDSCNSASGCVNAPIVCDDGSACTTDSCVGGTCQYDPVSTDDGNACTTDSCDAATGVHHDPVNCDDGDACTADSCNPADGCHNDPIAGCGNVCTSTDNPKNLAYWKRVCRGHGGNDSITAADAACVASQGDLFASVDEVKDICDALAGDTGISNTCSSANAQLMALALNICHERVCDSTVISSNNTTATTVGAAYDEADNALSTPTGNGCFYSKKFLSEINGGSALGLVAPAAEIDGGTIQSTRPVRDLSGR